MTTYSGYLITPLTNIVSSLDSYEVSPPTKISQYKQLTNTIMVISLAADYRAQADIVYDFASALNNNRRVETSSLIKEFITSLQSSVFSQSSVRTALDPRDMNAALKKLDETFFNLLRSDVKTANNILNDDDADAFLALNNISLKSFRF